MTFESFLQSLSSDTPPILEEALLSLWHDAKGNWEKAHDLIAETETPINNAIHAYLHRKEGDYGNAAYWYRKANKLVENSALQTEWEKLVKSLLKE